MVGCCPFLQKLKRKDKIESHSDPPVIRNTSQLISSREASRAKQRSASTDSQSLPVPLRPSSPASSSGDFYDCRSELGTSISSAVIDPSIRQDPQPEPSTTSSTWSLYSFWDLFGFGSSKNQLKRFSCRHVSIRGSQEQKENTTQMNSDASQLSNTEIVECASQTTVNGGQSRVLTALSNLMHHQRDPSTSYKMRSDGFLTCGSTFDRRPEGTTFEESKEHWEPADATKYRVRSKNYLRSRIKERCQGAFYEVIGNPPALKIKQTHVAKMIDLPSDPYKRTVEELEAIAEYGLPTLLIVNMQLPAYQPTLFGACDGPGHSFVFYCVLKEHFNPRTFSNKAALGLFQRFIRECGNQSQYRIKLIPKFLNVDEWAEKGPLTATEHRLVGQFNEKPILTRPYQHFFHETNYFEVDVDVHSWLFIARKAFWTLMPRMHEVVTEVAMLIQGSHADDLPEYIVAVARVYRVNLHNFRYLADMTTSIPASLKESEDGPVCS